MTVSARRRAPVRRIATAAAPAPDALEAYRDRHAGADVIVCGCGLSLAGFAPPPGAVTIGVNDVGRCFDPDYLVVLNGPAQFARDRWRHVAESRARAVFSHLDLPLERAPLVRFRLGANGGVDRAPPGRLHHARNSPYTAVHLAELLGARRIGLIGVDFAEGHFFAATGRHPLAPTLPQIEEQYLRLAAALAGRGIELVNLSALSRLQRLPRRGLSEFGRPRPALAPAPATMPEAAPDPAPETAKEDIAMPQPSRPTPPAPPRGAAAPALRRGGASRALTLAVSRQRPGPIGDFLDALATTAAGLGHVVRRGARGVAAPDVLAVVWNGRRLQGTGPTVFCEHGWLPRAAYQVSAQGINADSHLAPFVWSGKPLDAARAAEVEAHLAAIRAAALGRGEAARPKTPPAFYLAPLQMEHDTNLLRHAPARLRRMQDFVDAVAAADPPLPVIFKQHPADARRGGEHMRLRMRRGQDLLWAHARADVHALLASGRCAGILSINSNVVHDGLVHDVPAVALGRNIWPAEGPAAPFLAALPADWSALEAAARDPRRRACRLAYAHHLIQGQWTLRDAADPAKVAALLEEAAGSERRAPRAAPPDPAPPPARPLRPARRAAPPPAARTVVVRAARQVGSGGGSGFGPGGGFLNVYARDRGWRFEEIKADLVARAAARGLRLVASALPLPEAAAWIALRTREASASPDPARTLVMVHDRAGAEAYGAQGPRRGLAGAGAVQVAHASLAAVLRAAGVPEARILPCLAPGADSAAPAPAMSVPSTSAPAATAPATATAVHDEAPLRVGWFGRPEIHEGRERHRPDLFVAALIGLDAPVEALLAGESLDPAAAMLRLAGVPARRAPDAPPAGWPGLMAGLDAVALTGDFDPAPAALFAALAAGVPVVAPRFGWAADLLADGACGRIAEGPGALAAALRGIAAERAEWRARAPAIRAVAAAHPRDRWLDQCLDAAARLAVPPAAALRPEEAAAG